MFGRRRGARRGRARRLRPAPVRPGGVDVRAATIRAVAFAFVVAAASPARACPCASGTVAVRIVAVQFGPRDVVINVGDTVRWRNDDPAEHTVTHTGTSPPLFDSGAMQPGDVYAFRFTSLGRFDYWCAVHIDMVGSVTVA